MSIRLFVSDVDGTILPSGGKVSDRTKAAIAAAAEMGVPFVIVTGRWYPSARDVARALGQNEGYMIIANGGAVVDMDGNPLKEWTIPEADARKVYEILCKYDVSRHSFVRNAMYRMNTRALGKWLQKSMKSYVGQGNGCKIVNDDAEAFEKFALAAAYKMEAYSDDHALLQAAREELRGAGFCVSSSLPDNLEIVGQGMGKGVAVRWLAEHLGARMDECMAFGDNTNDLPMLEAVGWPVAVGNAVDELKKCAKIIAPRCDEDGVAQMIERALKGEF